MAALQAAEARLLEPCDLRVAVRHQPVRRGAVQRSSFDCPLGRALLLSYRQSLLGEDFRRRFSGACELSRSVYPFATRIEWQLRDLSAESFPLRHDRLLRRPSVPGVAHPKQLARHGSV